ncbi:NAD(P)H-dependent oxidoreductase [Sphingomonas sp. URHD0057]|uniref:NAD(P)H-dependent oxidoreductase n=1 Tax=Sphingomonas sp. URHD0057 TaxID=1380389 RepID=UPI000684EF5B|nr:NAD(P)H-dependent oxidoreductase [Sphingomonas sp. URHD0057]
MKTLVVLAHPERQSFCAELARRAIARMQREGDVQLLDLYAEDFDPVIRPSHFPQRMLAARFEPMVEQAHQAAIADVTPDIARHQAALEWSDRLMLVFPLWWWSMPAILKGWVDRVLSTDFAYGSRNLDGRIGMLCATAETKSERFAPTDGNNPLHHIERGILKFCGFKVAPSFVAAEIYDLSDDDRRQRLSDFETWIALHLASRAMTGTSS